MQRGDTTAHWQRVSAADHFARSAEARVIVSLIHAKCGGKFVHYTIPEHHYSFLQCEKCSHYLGGEKVAQLVSKLLRTKVRPHIERFS